MADRVPLENPGADRAALIEALNDLGFSPNRASDESPYAVDVYGSGALTGRTSGAFNSTDSNNEPGLERYALTAGSYGGGTGDGSVPGTTYASGHFAIKQDWFNTTREGQTCGLNVVSRGGYHGTGQEQAKYGLPYNPSGDQTTYLGNGVVSSYKSQGAAFEAVQFFHPNGNAAHPDVRGINVQLAPMRQLDVNGNVANPGIGVAVGALEGQMGAAYAAGNSGDGRWSHVIQFSLNDGVAPFVPYEVLATGETRVRGDATGTAASARHTLMNGNFYEFRLGDGTITNRFDSLGRVYVGTTLALAAPVAGKGVAQGTARVGDWNTEDAGIDLVQLKRIVKTLWDASIAKQFISA